MKNPDNPKHWGVNDEAVAVVKRILAMTNNGLGIQQIAARLEVGGVLTLRAYWISKGVRRPVSNENPSS